MMKETWIRLINAETVPVECEGLRSGLRGIAPDATFDESVNGFSTSYISVKTSTDQASGRLLDINDEEFLLLIEHSYGGPTDNPTTRHEKRKHIPWDSIVSMTFVKVVDL